MTTAATLKFKTSVHQNPTKNQMKSHELGRNICNPYSQRILINIFINIKITLTNQFKKKRNTHTIQLKCTKDRNN